MNIFSKEFWSGTPPVPEQTIAPVEEAPSRNPFNMSADYGNMGGSVYGRTFAIFDGETNMGEMGPPKEYVKDFYTLRVRSKQLFVESRITRTIVTRYTQWVVGRDLRLDSEPKAGVLKREGIELDTEKFNDDLEERWATYASSKCPDYAGQTNLPGLMNIAHMEGNLGGDVLVLLRVVRGLVRVQHIDGGHVGNPPGCTVSYLDENITGGQNGMQYDYLWPATGNRIRQGVEIDAKGMHVAYHVRVGVSVVYKRIKARDSAGFLRAYMVYGNRFDINATRGNCLMEAIMEEAKKMDRYNSAALSAAEIAAKFALFFEHDKDSLEDDPLAGSRATSFIAQPVPLGEGAAATDIAVDAKGDKIASDVSVTMNGTIVNLPRGVKANYIDNKRDANVEEFTMINIKLLCAAVNMPPNVAMMEYNDSFSASRMAGKDWEHTFLTKRDDFSQQYLNPIKDLQMYVWVLDTKIDAPGYLQKLDEGDEIAIAAYNHCNWVGDMFPDIDPLKTANYLRTMLGEDAWNAPLMTLQAASEMAGQGEWAPIAKQYGKNRELLKQLNIPEVERKGDVIVGAEDGKDGGGKLKQKTKKSKEKK